MQKTLVSTALILSTISFYTSDAAATGNVDCYALTETCRISSVKCAGFTSYGPHNKDYTPAEQQAVEATAQACQSAVNAKQDQTTACIDACNVYLAKYCTKETSCRTPLGI